MADEERTEDARPRQLEEAREKGRVPTSIEINTAFVVLSGFLILRFFGSRMLQSLELLATDTWRRIAQPELALPALQAGFADLLLRLGIMLGPFVLGIMLVGVAVNFAQVGPLLSFRIISPDFSRLDPTKGFKQLFSKQGLAEAAKSILKMCLIGYVAYRTIRSEAHDLDQLGILHARELLAYTCGVAFTVAWRVALVMLVIAGFDYAYQRWQHKQDMKVTRQEAKKADKDYDQDPIIKRHLREKQVQAATNRMMQEVPKADVVIVNPEHVAVALQYESGVMPTPMVIAKGADQVALRIKQIALEHDIPVIEDKPLAWLLYENLEIGMYIAEDMIFAVAAIFRRIYEQKGRL